MLDTLLESKPKKGRSPRGVALSVAAHTALIGAALYATAQARPQPPKPIEIIRPVYFPPAVRAAHSQTLATNSDRSTVRQIVFVAPKIDISVPAIEVPATATRATDFNPGALSGTTSDERARGNLEGSDKAPLLSDQVEKQASLSAGSKPPRYPETLRAAGVEGRVVALFIVSDQGVVEDGSIRILRSDNPLFDDAVRSALGRMRFSPAESGGKKVRQLVQMPFLFTLSR